MIGSPEVCRAAGGVSDSVARSVLQLRPSNQHYHSNSLPNIAFINTFPVIIIVSRPKFSQEVNTKTDTETDVFVSRFFMYPSYSVGPLWSIVHYYGMS